MDSAPGKLLADAMEGTSKDVADRAAQVFEALSQELSRLVGETGSRGLFARSIHLASAQCPWLVDAAANQGPDPLYAALRARLEAQPPDSAADGFALVLSTFLGLLERFIGAGLVARVLHQVFPTVFPQAVKETT
jgi:hypothetical protein